MIGRDKTEEHWIAGRRSVGKKGFLPVWEQGFPPVLLMRQRIRNRSLEELAELMSEFVRDKGPAVTKETPLDSAQYVEAACLGRFRCISQTFNWARDIRSESGSVYEPSIDSE
jgi:hypothetical protein